MAILGDFGEFEGPVPEPPYPYHHITKLNFSDFGTRLQLTCSI